jgi:aminoglycoside 3-N-acetyltransferase I
VTIAAADWSVRRLAVGDDALYAGMLDCFAEAFDDATSYSSRRPSPTYIARLLANDGFVALVAVVGAEVVGALAAYELPKFEQERSEFYLYDLAVRASHRRRGVARALIERLREIAAARGGWVVFVQADTDEDDGPAIALYESIGTREEVLHFDIPVRVDEPPA